ncbi:MULTISPECIES: transcriptional regulator CecR [unclassified Brenneria]|uniref:transcriptional regulator CecR n=1 Tax=unclassified Brenneria TaxID=2634434 RepID=UPI001557CD6F|nr:MULTISPECIES: transcriptional regulator CecR [unclassified Brenneria]MBJ7221218.1 transcriptional regulator CecR [Brenneria sp. L3-3C-1]MEE3642461.1 transcriptional regulator CecR [Brenneria sp. L3_3C_1]MEE3650175.1 transcriptional regulator CecR [Brenneria sp. HEZEL_4_2_4]NPD00133.1 transcriptional regulator CecR [Brenneria sp. hezel4-2-4]
MADKPGLPSRGDQTRQQLINAALEVFGEYGLKAATTRDIANRAGQNMASIAYHFQSKEGLYLAVASWIAEYIRQIYRPLEAEIEAYLQLPPTRQSAEQTMDYLQRCLFNFSRLMTRQETLNISRIMSREQLSPTDAYPLIHQQVIEPLHRLMTQLVARYTGMDEEDRLATIHTHALIGEVLAFRVARETILLRAGWQEIGTEQTTLIQQILVEHLEILLNGLRDNPARQTKG